LSVVEKLSVFDVNGRRTIWAGSIVAACDSWFLVDMISAILGALGFLSVCEAGGVVEHGDHGRGDTEEANIGRVGIGP